MGVYYVIFSLISLVYMVDLGIAASFKRAVGYAWGGAKNLKEKGVAETFLETSGPYWPLVADLVETMRVFFRYTAFAGFIFVGLAGGIYLLSVRPENMSIFEIGGLWFTYLLFASFNYASNVWSVLLQSGNNVRDYQMFFTFSLVFGYITSIGGLFLGWGLWAMCASFAIQIVILRCCCQISCRMKNARPLWEENGIFRKDCLGMIWPVSWRFGLAQSTGSLMMSLPVLICSSVLGLAVSASLGVTLQLATALAQISGIGFSVKIPLFNIMRASGNISGLRKVFETRSLWNICFYVCFGTAAFIAAPWFFKNIIKTNTDLLNGLALILTLAFVGFESFQSMFARLLLSGNHVPYWKRSIFVGLFLAFAGYTGAVYFGLIGLLFSLLFFKLIFFDFHLMRLGLNSIDCNLSLALSRFFYSAVVFKDVFTRKR